MKKEEFLSLKPQQQIGVVLYVMQEIVAEVGRDFVYVQNVGYCTYYHKTNGCADCLIGRVLAKLGWSLQELRAVDEVTDGGPNGSSIGNPEVFPEIPRETRIVLKTAQYDQDTGNTWGLALDDAFVVARDV